MSDTKADQIRAAERERWATICDERPRLAAGQLLVKPWWFGTCNNSFGPEAPRASDEREAVLGRTGLFFGPQYACDCGDEAACVICAAEAQRARAEKR